MLLSIYFILHLAALTFSRVVKGFVIQGGNLATREKLTPELMRRITRASVAACDVLP